MVKFKYICSNCSWEFKNDSLICLCGLRCHLEDSYNHVKSADCPYCKSLIQSLYYQSERLNPETQEILPMTEKQQEAYLASMLVP